MAVVLDCWIVVVHALALDKRRKRHGISSVVPMSSAGFNTFHFRQTSMIVFILLFRVLFLLVVLSSCCVSDGWLAGGGRCWLVLLSPSALSLFRLSSP